jgi:poly[(R)-3-hydroxyalkanoate] polymerase subunit PhaC
VLLARTRARGDRPVATGHIQTIVNPPGKPKAGYFAGPAARQEPADWLERATRHAGLWWPHCAEWLLARSGEERAAPKRLGNRRHHAA